MGAVGERKRISSVSSKEAGERDSRVGVGERGLEVAGAGALLGELSLGVGEGLLQGRDLRLEFDAFARSGIELGGERVDLIAVASDDGEQRRKISIALSPSPLSCSPADGVDLVAQESRAALLFGELLRRLAELRVALALLDLKTGYTIYESCLLVRGKLMGGFELANLGSELVDDAVGGEKTILTLEVGLDEVGMGTVGVREGQ